VPANRFALAPVDPRFVARVLADAAQGGPGGRLAPVAGPQSAPLGELARVWARARARHVLALAVPLAPRARRALMGGALVPDPDAAVTGGPSFAQWLQAREAAAVAG